MRERERGREWKGMEEREKEIEKSNCPTQLKRNSEF